MTAWNRTGIVDSTSAMENLMSRHRRRIMRSIDELRLVIEVDANTCLLGMPDGCHKISEVIGIRRLMPVFIVRYLVARGRK